jgi:hypothetical protein
VNLPNPDVHRILERRSTSLGHVDTRVHPPIEPAREVPVTAAIAVVADAVDPTPEAVPAGVPV